MGAGVLASAVSMDKAFTKRLCQQAGLPVVPYVTLLRGQFDAAEVQVPLRFPVFVKPANLGSSVGITKVTCACRLAEALEAALRFDRKILVEQGVQGREFECAVLGGMPARASVPCEILPSQDFYTYEDKYLLDQAKIELPPKLNEAQIAEVQRLGRSLFRSDGLRRHGPG